MPVSSETTPSLSLRYVGIKSLTDLEFQKFSSFIYDICGIKLPPLKKNMLSARLIKRLRQLNIASFSDYFDYVTSPYGQQHELFKMIDVVSTNKTDFFRETKHFDFLTSHILPEFVNRLYERTNRKLYLWSAGCSSGEEPYTLAMILEDFFSQHKGLDYSILATDISSRVLSIAKRGIYADSTTISVPTAMRHKYLMRGKGSRKGTHRVVPELRRKIAFRWLNFMDDDFGIEIEMDIIFCRNVIIYFDHETQVRLFEKFYKQFSPGGYLFTGHSESLEGITDRMERVTSAVYRCVK